MRFGKSAAVRAAAAAVIPRLPQVAPGLTGSLVREILAKAITGIGPLPPATKTAQTKLAGRKGNVDKGIHDVIEKHVRYAAVQGFVTNLGGLMVMPVTVPANVTGLALLQSRMIAGIAHLRGYDIEDSRVRDAILATLLGEERVLGLVKSGRLPGSPMELALASTTPTDLATHLGTEVANELMAGVTGKRIVGVAARRTPVVGGVVGASSDAFTTWKLGRYADREFLPVNRR